MNLSPIITKHLPSVHEIKVHTIVKEVYSVETRGLWSLTMEMKKVWAINQDSKGKQEGEDEEKMMERGREMKTKMKKS